MLGCSAGQILALVGPTQVGKSLLFDICMDEISKNLRPVSDNHIPLIKHELKTANDGRISTKLVVLELLKKLKHPLYTDIGELIAPAPYRVRNQLEESMLRLALACAVDTRCTEIIGLDEAQLMTRTRDPTLRANILESFKTLCSRDRTLFLSGGYELCVEGFFDSAHFAGRLVVVEFPPYSKSSLTEWLRLIKTVGTHLELHPLTLLVDMGEELLDVCLGVPGLVLKLLQTAGQLARAHGDRSITKDGVRVCYPKTLERDVIRRDIERGQRSLEQYVVGKPPTPQAAESPKRTRPPFERDASRHPTAVPDLHDA